MIKCPECGETLSDVIVVLKVSGWEHAGYRWDEDEEKFIYYEIKDVVNSDSEIDSVRCPHCDKKLPEEFLNKIR